MKFNSFVLSSVICLLEARFRAKNGPAPYPFGFGPSDAVSRLFLTSLWWSEHVPRRISHKEQRKWARLQLAIPVFLRARDDNGKDFLEFATALNVSAGGALVLMRRSLPKSAAVSLEIPSAPVGPARGLKRLSRIMHAKTVWVTHLDEQHLLGLKFARPLNTDRATIERKPARKAGSIV